MRSRKNRRCGADSGIIRPRGRRRSNTWGCFLDIRNVMTNDALRRKEAEEAKRLFIEREKETTNRIDRHIALLLSKGRISGDEISKLARLNSVPEERIQERVAKKKRLFLINCKIEELVRTGKTDPRYHGGLIKEFSLDPGKFRNGSRTRNVKNTRRSIPTCVAAVRGVMSPARKSAHYPGCI